MAQFPKSTGKAPGAKGGSNRRLDHPSCGTMPGTVDNKTMNPTKPAGGKAQKSMGGGERKGSYPSAPSFPAATRSRRPAEKW
jgi:hypothetical protein